MSTEAARQPRVSECLSAACAAAGIAEHTLALSCTGDVSEAAQKQLIAKTLFGHLMRTHRNASYPEIAEVLRESSHSQTIERQRYLTESVRWTHALHYAEGLLARCLEQESPHA